MYKAREELHEFMINKMNFVTQLYFCYPGEDACLRMY